MTERDESGFTLIELLISILILGIVFGVVSAAFILSLTVTGESTTRLLESQDGAFTSAYFVRDIQSSESVEPGVAGCASATGTAVLKLSWDEQLSAGAVNYVVDYRYSSGQLIRYTCAPGTSTTTTATQLRSSPSVSCSPVTAPTLCVSPKTVTMTLTDAVDGVFAIRAARRLT